MIVKRSANRYKTDKFIIYIIVIGKNGDLTMTTYYYCHIRKYPPDHTDSIVKLYFAIEPETLHLL